MVSFSLILLSEGREELLLKCLESLNLPTQDWQLVIVSNGHALSEKVMGKARTLSHETEFVQLPHVETPGKAKNVGLQYVKYDWTFFLDEDCYVLPRYFEIILPLLSLEKIDVLGGPEIAAKGANKFSQALAMTLASPFCSGPSFARYTSKGRHLIPCGEESLSSSNLWARTHLLKEVSFPDDDQISEGTALIHDLKQRGAHLFYHPGLLVGRYQDRNLQSVLNSVFKRGHKRSRTIKEKSINGSGLFWLAPLFVVLHLLVFLSPVLFWSLFRFYFGIIVMMSLNLGARRKKMGLFPLISIFHYLIVFAYGLGFLSQRLGFKSPK